MPCNCKAGCKTNRCSCRKAGEYCNEECKCIDCTNAGIVPDARGDSNCEQAVKPQAKAIEPALGNPAVAGSIKADMEIFKFSCPNCKTQLQTQAKYINESTTCTMCKHEFVAAYGENLQFADGQQNNSIPQSNIAQQNTLQQQNKTLQPSAKPQQSSAPQQNGSSKFFIKESAESGKKYGPYSKDKLKQLAKDGKISPSWYVSHDQQKWHRAARVSGLFGHVDQAVADGLTTPKKYYKKLSIEDQAKIFRDMFLKHNETLQDTAAIFRHINLFLGEFIIPRNYFVSRVSESGTKYIKHDLKKGAAYEISEQEFKQNIERGINKPNWIKALYYIVLIIWGLFAFNLGHIIFGVMFSIVCAMIATIGYVAEQRSKTYVGYTLDKYAVAKLKKIVESISALTKSHGVWIFELQEIQENREHSWKYHAGETISVSKMPAAVFNRKIPNINTNIRVYGVTAGHRALYFLPEKALLLEHGRLQDIDYRNISLHSDYIEYVESDRSGVKGDSEIIAKRWKYINKDGTRDKRFNNNYELPVVRCGILDMGVKEESLVKFVTSNNNSPNEFIEKMKVAIN